MGALDLLIGCILVGVFLNVWLYGFSCLQYYHYHVTFHKTDRWPLRLFVAGLFLADTLNTIFSCHFVYDYLITHFGDLEYIMRANWSFTTDPFMVGIISFSCQLFFAWRVHRLTRSIVWPGIITALSLASLLGAIGSTIGVQIVKQFQNFQKFNSVVTVWLLCAALADTLITAVLLSTLNKSRTGFQQTDDLISKLMRNTIQTGLATSLVAIADLVAFLASPTTVHLIFNFMLPKLYINSLLSTLNSRAAISNVIYAADVASGGGVRVVSNHNHREPRHGVFNPSSSQNSGGKIGGFVGRVLGTSQSNESNPRLGGTIHSPYAARDMTAVLENGIHVHTVEERFENKNLQEIMMMESQSGNSSFNHEDDSPSRVGMMPVLTHQEQIPPVPSVPSLHKQ